MEDAVRRILTTYCTWGVVGCSPDPWRDSHRIAGLLLRHGFNVVPINPHAHEIHGRRCFPTLADAAAHERIEVVDVFRRSAHAGAHVDEAIAIGARAVWLQLGVIDPDAAERAAAAGLDVVMDRCPAIELPRIAAA